ncbi:ArsR/SmtB family transcription factor [Amycolatopsis nigrescens]|uniref:ArsR/SmtB family transcription factor n=1 Tax=Amycolatopsis nigrescens TaxID=381445 RepID=UPI0003742D5D|nr:SRPBCC domain-containing protein [Amycolatopsis nigrescens]
MTDDDRVFKALADPTRRFLLDRLFDRDGRTLTELESELEMTRFGVMKHLRVLEEANLLVVRKSGREKLHFLNAVPIRLIHDRWIDKYTERRIAALTDLKAELEEKTMPTKTENKVVYVHRVYIKATPEAIWDAITKPEWTQKYGYQCPVEYDLRPGGEYKAFASDAMKAYGDTPDVLITGEVIECDPPRRLVQTWHPQWEPVEGVTRLVHEIVPGADGVTSLTVTHELADSPNTAAMVNGEVENAGGGWPEILSDLKTLLETGKSLHS